MKATLQFDLPEEENEYQLAVEGPRWQLVVWTLVEVYLRNKFKYDFLSSDANIALEGVRAEIFRMLEEQSLSLEG